MVGREWRLWGFFLKEGGRVVLGLHAALASALFSRKGRMGLCGDDIRRFRLFTSMELRSRKSTSCSCERTASRSPDGESTFIWILMIRCTPL